MAGGMLAAHAESGGELIELNGRLFKQFYGWIPMLEIPSVR
jgi:GMP reductase